MASKKVNSVKLGMFVLAGLAVLVLLLYVIGKNQNMFGKTFVLKAQFENVFGLTAGNNIRFAGIDAGSVKNVQVLNDTTIEVILLVKTNMKRFIHRNAQISIATDGLIGNRIVNIEPVKSPSPEVAEGDVLKGMPGNNAEEMLKVLNNTNKDIAVIAGEIKKTILRINQSKVVWSVLEDETLPLHIRQSLNKIKSTTAYMDRTMSDVSFIVDDVKRGKGTLGKLLRDSAMALEATNAMATISSIGETADSLSGQISAFVAAINRDVNEGKGTVQTLLKNEETAQRLNNTIKNIEQDTKAFGEVMEALKQNFLFRSYFRKLQKEKTKRESGITKGKY
jgi:phospholipid/cholesterol/gamma-HCH transport system substrate-binding protein